MIWRPSLLYRKYILSKEALIDILPAIPWDFIASKYINNQFAAGLRCLHLLRLFHFKVYYTAFARFFRKINVHFSFVDLSSPVRRTFLLIARVLVLIHWMACVWHFSGTVGSAWMGDMDGSIKHGSWIDDDCTSFNLDCSSILNRYVRSVYFILIAMTTAGIFFFFFLFFFT